ncbi:hypothetical protein DXG03_007812 [Asterophora parasitica]|uniref:Uncharacterized protein n=1 Tax=Asterophora parasitica TaxID=117018 RepID=A0A9P7GD84_9AGAR|nr:hypothetical protein DXG03_007812 [Asterophora parasitica]
MSAPPLPDTSQELPGKRKGRALEPTESTPLLTGQSRPSSNDESPSPMEQTNSSRRLRSRLTIVFLVSLSLCIGVFVLLALLAWSYAAKVSQISPDDVLRDGMVLRGPDRVDVVNITSGEIWLSIDTRLGVNAGAVAGMNSDLEGASLLVDLWKCVGRWGVRKLERVSVSLSTITITPDADPLTILASIETSPLTIPLTVNPPNDLSWLTHVPMLALVRPNNDTSTLIAFLRDAWRDESINIRAHVARTLVQGGAFNESGWRTKLHQKFANINMSFHLAIPSLPGLPRTGPKGPFPSVHELVTLKFFSISSESDRLAIRAAATIINPAPSTFNMTSPSIPFIVSLPSNSNSSRSPIPVASISSAPFTLTHPNITLDISGTVLPLGGDAGSTLSSFLSHYLSKQFSPILISSPLLPNFSLETLFPPPNPPPNVLRNVTIKDMKIKPGTTFLASGTVYARIVLPKGIDVDLNVSRVLPDALVFDGEVPESALSLPPPPEPPLPDPLPEKAFGRIRPENWLKAFSARDQADEDDGAAYAVAAKIVDVPLEVLPGRQKEFSNFVSKVLFSTDGAIAGILGTVAVVTKDDLGDRRQVERLARDSLARGLSVCIDRTNFNAFQRSYWIEIAREFPGTSVWVIVFDTPYETCAARLRTRTSHPTITNAEQGLYVLSRFAADFEYPAPHEGHDRIISLKPADTSPVYSRSAIAAILQRVHDSSTGGNLLEEIPIGGLMLVAILAPITIALLEAAASNLRA